MRQGRDVIGPTEIAAGVNCLQFRAANVYFVRSGASWVLIDAGWSHNSRAIQQAAQALFGPNVRPAAILLTHAHPDHVGSAAELARLWELPIHVHPGDLPLLTGEGISVQHLHSPVDRPIAVLMRLLPPRTFARMTPSDLRDAAHALLHEGAGLPGLPDWECVSTPGHSPGHVVFFRRSDRVLIAGDAVLTAPFWGLLPRRQRISPPPWVSSWDWRRTKDSVAVLVRLEPRVLATGHGVPMAGAGVAADLHAFSDRFSRR